MCCFREFCLLACFNRVWAFSSLLHLLYLNPFSASKLSQELHSDFGHWEGPVKFSEMLGDMLRILGLVFIPVLNCDMGTQTETILADWEP